MAIDDGPQAFPNSAANAAPMQQIPSSYGPVRAIADMRTTLYTTPPKQPSQAIVPYAAAASAANAAPGSGGQGNQNLAIRPFADGSNQSNFPTIGGSQMAVYYDINRDPNQATIDERERWRQVSHAWAARLMEGLNDRPKISSRDWR